MFSLTKQEQLIIVGIIAALLVGSLVKRWRESRPTALETTQVGLASERTE